MDRAETDSKEGGWETENVSFFHFFRAMSFLCQPKDGQTETDSKEGGWET